MFDRAAVAWMRPLVQALARPLVRAGIAADAITWAGFAIGLAAAIAIGFGEMGLALVLMLLSRCCDGLDGAVARLTTPTDRGAFLDITLDFLFYAAVPLAFAVHDPARNALAAAVLLAAFIGTGSSFLAFALLAERRGLKSIAFPDKGIYYLGGLTEAGETLVCFVLMCLWPRQFAMWATAFALLCGLTLTMRLAVGWRQLR